MYFRLFDPPIEGHRRVTTKDPVTLSEILRIPFGPRSAWRCLLSRRRVFTIICRPGLFGCASRPASEQLFKFCVERNPWDMFYRITYARPTASARSSLDQYFARPSSRSITRATPRHPEQNIVDRVVRFMKIMIDDLANFLRV